MLHAHPLLPSRGCGCGVRSGELRGSGGAGNDPGCPGAEVGSGPGCRGGAEVGSESGAGRPVKLSAQKTIKTCRRAHAKKKHQTKK